MVTRFHLLNGETIDLEQRITYPVGDIEDEYNANFADEANPWWLSFDTDNGSQSFSGFASAGGTGTTQLNTGGVSAGDVSNLETPALNWDNWSELWFIIANDGQIISDSSAGHVQVTFGDARNADNMTDGFKIRTNTSNQSATWEVLNGGTTQLNGTTGNDKGSMFGFRLFENTANSGSTGHTIVFYNDWEPVFQHAEDGGFPSVAEYPLRVGCISGDGSDQSVELDRVYLGLTA